MRKQVAAISSEPQGVDREVGAERSGERNRASTNRNRIGGVVSEGERALRREALATKRERCRSGDGAGKAEVLTWGDLALRLKGRRRETEREVSRGRSTVGEAGRSARRNRDAGRIRRGKDRTDERVHRP